MMKSLPDQPAEPRRTLRLSAIFVQLREEAVPIEEAQTGGTAQPTDAPADRTEPDATFGADTVTSRRHLFHHPPRVRSNITIGEILDRTRQAGFGFIAALLALIAIPFSGVSTPFGLAIAYVGVQMMAGLPHPWLPERIRRRCVSMATLQWLGDRLARWTGGLERVIRPRLTFMIAGPFWTACGVGIVIQALALALPLPIPGSNWVFIVPIILYGIGLLESDGLLIIICHCLTLIEVALGVWLWEVIVRGLRETHTWFANLLG